jgi:single-strand DNA-binding protein
MSLNKVLIIGRVGNDPEMRYTASGTEMCTFSVATSDSYTSKAGEKKEKTEWHKVIAWGVVGKICSENLAKGSLVYIDGKLTTNSWEDKSGNKRQTTQVQVLGMQKLADGKGGAPKPVNQQEPPPSSREDEIPF